MHKRLAAWVMALLVLLPAVGVSQTWTRQYGGSREDRLKDVVSAGDGLLLAGYTLSTDGNLSMRTREGKAGWLLRLDSEGNILWSYCSAHVGRDEMLSPFAHADGTVSVTLRGEGRGSEWLHLDERGRLLERVEMPEIGEGCPHGAVSLSDGVAVDANGAPRFRIHAYHADGSVCSRLYAPDGSAALEGVFPPRSLPDDPQNMPTWKYSPDGRMRAETNVIDSELNVVFSHLDGGERMWVKIHAPQGRMHCVPDYLFNSDDTLIVNTQLENGSGVITRVSVTGEVLFNRRTDGGLLYMVLTDAGFAGVDGRHIQYFDEDGNLLAETELPQDFEATGLARLGEGAAAVDCLTQGTKNIVHAQLSYPPDSLMDWYKGAVYAGRDMRVLEAEKHGEGVLMLCEHRDGWRTLLLVDSQGRAVEAAEGLAYDGASQIGLKRGSLRFEEEAFGARVVRLREDGQEIWSMRTPIHTAADKLLWRCACELSDGSLLLGGCYITQLQDGSRREAVLAHVSGQGVLAQMEMLPDAADICALLPQEGGVAALVALDGDMDGGHFEQAQALRMISGKDVGKEKLLPFFLEPDSAWLFSGPDGVPLAVGTSESGGRLAAVVQRVDDMPSARKE